MSDAPASPQNAAIVIRPNPFLDTATPEPDLETPQPASPTALPNPLPVAPAPAAAPSSTPNITNDAVSPASNPIPPALPYLANSAEELFGPPPKYFANNAAELFGPPPTPAAYQRVMDWLWDHHLPDPAELLGGKPVKPNKPGEPRQSVVTPIVDAAIRGWGGEPLGLSPDTEKWLKEHGLFNDWQKEDGDFVKHLNEATAKAAGVPFGSIAVGAYNVYQQKGLAPALRFILEPELRDIATGFDVAGRALSSGFAVQQAATYEALGESSLARDIAALPEAFQGSPHPFGIPAAPEPGLVTSESGVAGDIARERLSPTGIPSPTERVRRPAEPAAAESPVAEPAAAEPIAPDVHAVARQIAPKVFEEYDALSTRKETFRNWLDDLAAQRDRGLSPEISDLDKQIDALRERRLAETGRTRIDTANEITSLEARRQNLTDNMPEAGDTPEMAKVRRDLMATDARMRDLAPDVSAAYRNAAETGAPVEPASLSAGAPLLPETAPEPAAAPTRAVPEPTAAVPPIPGGIANDFANRLIAAGRPADEAAATGEVVQARYEARAASLRGTTPEGLYREDAPRVVRARQRVPEMAQPGELGQGTTELFDWTPGGGSRVEKFGNTEITYGVSRDGRSGEIILVKTPREARGQGSARAALEQLTSEADNREITLFLNSDPMDRGISKSKLDRFYKSLGFVKNTGRNKDFLSTAEFVRRPAESRILEQPRRGRTVDIGGHELPLNDDGTVTLYHATKTAEQANRIISEKTIRSGGEPSVYLSTARDGTGYGDHVVAIRVNPRLLRIDDEFPGGRADFAIDKRSIKVSDAIRSDELNQPRRGAIRLGDPAQKARSVIKIFREADASTAIHELGHDWLEQMVRDARDERATDQLRTDMQTIRGYLGLPDDATLRERDAKGRLLYVKEHEKFARSFERYMMEGHAPSAKLAGVFARFKQWLTDIYRTVAKLRAPISDDIRRVFDRMISTPEDRAVVAPEIGAGEGVAGIHETDVAATSPEHAAPVADMIAAERDRMVEEAPKEIQSGRPNRPAEPTDRLSPQRDSALDRGGDAGQFDTAGSGDGAEPGAVGEGGTATAPQGSGVAGGTGREPAGGREPVAGSRTTPPAGANASFERAPESGVIDKAGNIRLDLLNTPEDVNTILRQTAADNNGFISERRGVIPDAEVGRLADALGMDAGQLNRRRIGQAFNAEEIVAARRLLIQSATEVRDLMRKAATGSDADVLAYAQAKARHLMIMGQVSGITAEAGRALRAFREISQMEGAQAAIDLGQSFLKLATGRDLNQLREEAQNALSLDTPRKLSQFVRDTFNPKLWDKATEIWTNALLSNPITHEANIIGNTLSALYSIPETGVAGGIGRVRTLFPNADPARVELGEMGARAFGIIRGSQDGIRAGWELLKNEDLADLHNKADAGRYQAIGGTTGQIVRIPGRLLGAEDKVFKQIAYRQELNAQAYRRATSEGLTGDKFSTRVAELTNHPTPEMIDAATRHMDYATFNSQLGHFGNAILSLSKNYPVVRFIVPFVRTPLNLVKYAAERSPFGLMMKGVRENLSGKNGAVARDTAIARMALGTSISIASAYWAAQGVISGGGPSDPRKSAALRATGWQPYSIRIGDTWYAHSRLDPFSMLIGVAADMWEIKDAATNDEKASIAKMIFGSISKNLISRTWLKGPSDLAQAFSDPDRYGENYIKNMAGTVVPSGIAEIERLHDPYMREARTVIDSIKSRIPILGETLWPRRDILGDPILREESFLPIAQSQMKDNPVFRALQETGAFPARMERKVGNIDLTDEQYDKLEQIAGGRMKTHLNAVVRSPAYQALPMEMKKEMLTKTITSDRMAARAALTASDDSLKAKIRQKKLEAHGMAPH